MTSITDMQRSVDLYSESIYQSLDEMGQLDVVRHMSNVDDNESVWYVNDLAQTINLLFEENGVLRTEMGTISLFDSSNGAVS